jgi:hypothetical protein
MAGTYYDHEANQGLIKPNGLLIGLLSDGRWAQFEHGEKGLSLVKGKALPSDETLLVVANSHAVSWRAVQTVNAGQVTLAEPTPSFFTRSK